MSKEMFIDAYGALIQEYLDSNPDATKSEAEAWAEGRAYGRMQDRYADMIDSVRMARK